MKTSLPRLPALSVILAIAFAWATNDAQAVLLSYWDFNNVSPAYNSGTLGSFSTTANGTYGEAYTQSSNSVPGTLASNTANSTVFNGSAIKIDFANIGTITGLPNGPTINGKKGAAYTTQEGTIGYAGYGTFSGSTTNAVGSDAAGDSLIFLNGSNTLNGKYITFALSSAGYDTLSLSYAIRLSSGMNNTSTVWTYSTDGSNFSALTTTNYATGTGSFVSTSLNLSTLSSSALNNQSAIYLRMAFNSGYGAGSYAFDNFQLTGTALAPVPEPSTYALIGGAGALGLAFLIRRKRR